MTDAQIALLCSAIVTVGGMLIAALKWAVNRVTASNDAGTTALIANTASNAVLVVKLDNLAGRIDGIGDFVEEVSGVHDAREHRRRLAAEQEKRSKVVTPVRGVKVGYYGPSRPKTDTDF